MVKLINLLRYAKVNLLSESLQNIRKGMLALSKQLILRINLLRIQIVIIGMLLIRKMNQELLLQLKSMISSVNCQLALVLPLIKIFLLPLSWAELQSKCIRIIATALLLGKFQTSVEAKNRIAVATFCVTKGFLCQC